MHKKLNSLQDFWVDRVKYRLIYGVPLFFFSFLILANVRILLAIFNIEIFIISTPPRSKNCNLDNI